MSEDSRFKRRIKSAAVFRIADELLGGITLGSKGLPPKYGRQNVFGVKMGFLMPVTLLIGAREEDRKVCKTIEKKLRNVSTILWKSVTDWKLGFANFRKVDSEVAGLRSRGTKLDKGNPHGLLVDLTSRRYLISKGEIKFFEILSSNHEPKVFSDFGFYEWSRNVECQIKKSTSKAVLCCWCSISGSKSKSAGGRLLFYAGDLQREDRRLIDDSDVNLISNPTNGTVITHKATMTSFSKIQDGRDVSSFAYYGKHDTLFSGAFNELQTYVSG